jgi:ketosteroid isomerase-like protein
MEVTMPWFPDFVAAIELSRRDMQIAGRADPVAQYLRALEQGDSHLLEEVWPAQVVVHDPLVGEVRGHKELRHFVRRNQAWLGEQHAKTETVAATSVGRRAVVELLAHLERDGRSVSWPVAVVAESPDDQSVVFRTYCSVWPVDGHRRVRHPILGPGTHHPGDVVGRYQAALHAGDTDAILQTFQPDGSFREPIGLHALHCGTAELRLFFLQCFSSGGGVKLEQCEVTDDGERCVLEYNCVGWGSHDLPPQAGIAVFDRGTDGLLTAVRVYDDVEPPSMPSSSLPGAPAAVS